MQQFPVPAPSAAHVAAQRRAHLMRELVETLLFVGIVFVIVRFVVNPFRITDTRMQPQLQPDQLVLVNRVSYVFAGPSRGDVVVYDNPQKPNEQVIGRVIAVPGDTIAISATKVMVNGVALNETYTHSTTQFGNSKIVAPTKLGNSEYYIMIDNRQFTGDSRDLGPVPRQNIVGKAVLVFWPLKSFGGVSNFSNDFSNVH